MNNYDSVKQVYQQRIETFSMALQQVNKKRTQIAWLRFGIVVITILIIIYGWESGTANVLILEGIAGLSIFLFIVSKDMNAKAEAENLQRLIGINETESAILNGNFTNRETGLHFQPHHHSYADDLDIFGEYSIYQYINRCTSEQGKNLLAQRLLHPLTKAEIEKEQQAVKEATSAIDWRQQLVADGMESSLTVATQQRIEAWIKQSLVYNTPIWKWISIIFPVISLGTVLLYVFDIIAASAFYAVVALFFLFAFSLSKKISPVWVLLSRITDEAGTLQKLLSLIEEQSFTNQNMLPSKAHSQAKKTAMLQHR